jgi:hypothetical protein
MPECHWSAREIVDKINNDEKDDARGMLQSEMNKLPPGEFKRLVDEMVRLTKNDKDEWNDVEFTLDNKNEIRSVSINDSYLVDTQLARKGAPTPLNFVLSLNHDCTINK